MSIFSAQAPSLVSRQRANAYTSIKSVDPALDAALTTLAQVEPGNLPVGTVDSTLMKSVRERLHSSSEVLRSTARNLATTDPIIGRSVDKARIGIDTLHILADDVLNGSARDGVTQLRSGVADARGAVSALLVPLHDSHLEKLAFTRAERGATVRTKVAVTIGVVAAIVGLNAVAMAFDDY